MLLGIATFLLAAGSLARDLDPVQAQLVFSRPVSVALYVVGKYLGVVTFTLGVWSILLLVCLFRPLLSSHWTIYHVPPFLLVTGLCLVPMVAYACALAAFLIALAGRVIVALPIYLLYFYCAVLMRSDETAATCWQPP